MAERRIVLLCQRGGFAPLHQAASAAAAAVSMGHRVDLVLFHAALARWLEGRIDQPPGPGEFTTRGDALESGRVLSPGEVLAGAREQGAKLFACSASVALLGHDAASVLDRVDEVVGWPTILNWIAKADSSISF